MLTRLRLDLDMLAVLGFDDVRLSASMWLAWNFGTVGRLTEAEPFLRTAQTLAPQVDDPFSQAAWGVWDGILPNWAGRFDEALEHLERWRSAAERSGHILPLLQNRWVGALAHGGKGEYKQALALLKDIIATCDRVGEVAVRARGLNSTGWVYGELQDYPAGDGLE